MSAVLHLNQTAGNGKGVHIAYDLNASLEAIDSDLLPNACVARYSRNLGVLEIDSSS